MSTDEKDPSSRGRPSAARTLRETSTAAVEAIHRASGSAAELARRAARGLSGSGDALLASLLERTRDASEALWRLSKDATIGLLPKKRVRAFLLPTGSGRRDFLCILDFREIVEQLAGGRFARPYLEVWAAREDVDRLALAESLREEFTAQLEEERRRSSEETERGYSPLLQRLDEEKTKAGSMVETATFGFTSSLLLMFFLSNPIFNLLFLSLAVFSGAGGVTKALRYLQVTARIRSNERDWGKEKEKLESELSGKNQEFRSAIGNLEIKVHPELERILVHISELDGEAFIPSGGLEGSGEPLPSMRSYLKMPRYREAVPDLYHPLLDAEIG